MNTKLIMFIKKVFLHIRVIDQILSSSGLLKKKFELNYYIDEKENKFVNTKNKSLDDVYQRKLVIYKKNYFTFKKIQNLKF